MKQNDISPYTINPEQKKAITHGKGPLLIIAGAGTGKTTVITERIKHLITSEMAKPQEILALTFTEKASREMEERVDMALPYGVTQMWISTFHSFCDKVLRNDGLAIGLNPNYRLMSEAETIQFFQNHLYKFDLEYYRPLGNPYRFISGMIQHFSRLKDEDVSPTHYASWVEKKFQISNLKSQMKSNPPSGGQNSNEEEEQQKYNELAHAYRKYEELKVQEGVADYGDLIANTLKLFRTRMSILAKYQEQFKYILIDEFQDTNFSQNELAILISGKKQNITVVGDDDQAIYRWRGAAVSNIIQFRKRFPKARVVVLTKNYRSTKAILDTSYTLIQNNNPDRLETVEKIDKRLECIRRINGERPHLVFFDRVEHEAEEVAKIIQNSEFRIQNNGTKYSWKDFAILVRANAHAESFARALSRHGIPYQFLGPGQLFKQPEVKDLIAYLKVLSDINDSIAMYRVLSMDIFAINPRDIASLVSYAKQNGVSLFQACEAMGVAEVAHSNLGVLRSSSPIDGSASSAKNPNVSALSATPVINNENRDKISRLVSMIHSHLGLLKKETAGQILYYFLEQTGLLASFTSYKTTKDQRTAENIAKFFDKLKTYEMDHEDASVFAVVDWLDLSMELGESPLASIDDWNARDAVNIMTIHSAKGLEFPVVFLVNLVSQRFPTTERKEQIPIPDELIKEIIPRGDFHIEEERRLFYVGMTRARDQLYMTASRYYGEGKREKKISPFVVEALGEAAVREVTVQAQPHDIQLSFLDYGQTKKDTEEKAVFHPKTLISYSEYESFVHCPLQYKYRYVIKIPIPENEALVFGTCMHAALKSWYDQILRGEKPTNKDLCTYFQDFWRAKGHRNRLLSEKMYTHGIRLLTEYFNKGYDPNTKTISVEQPFRIKLSKTLSVKGKIDRVDQIRNDIEIIDYKTGSAPKKRKPEDDLQLSVYALAATDEGLYGKKPEDITVSFYFFEGQQKVSAKRTSAQLEEAKQKIISVADAISTSTFKPTPGMHCDFCEFRLICEAWK